MAAAVLLAGTAAAGAAEPGPAGPLRIVALGDSLVAGYGLPPGDGFTAQLQKALAAKGHTGARAVEIVNAGVSGDTAQDGLARLDWALPDDADAVLVELGANDALRGIDPAVTRKALDEILRRLTARGIPVLLCGMQAPPNLGPDYKTAFDPLFPALAATHKVPLYPFFLDGAAAELGLNQPDGMHPNAAGVKTIVARILPAVEALVDRAAARRDRS
ncbi:arylesterase [Rhodoplanes sp.]|uniref:arylesterase n=1 Tax=Rhodoplanes sp. TaxID=1968906 RepID=UPI0025F72C5E|nr:arylesterase [Rhodoplanes sp.]